MNWLLDLFSSEFTVRSQCGNWSPVYLWIYAASNAIITLAYLMIPIVLLLPLREQENLGWLTRGDKLVIRFTYANFILACGIGHLDGVLSFFVVYYHFWAVWHLLTALVSLWAVYVTFYYRARIITHI